MKIKIIIFALALLTSGVLTSCSVDDDQLEVPAYATGGDEVDDPAEPDEKD